MRGVALVVSGVGLDWRVRTVLVMGVVAGVVSVGSVVVRTPGLVGVNFEVYYRAASALVDGGGIYGVATPGPWGYQFVYPPIVVVPFVPFLVFGEWWQGFVVFTVVNVGAGVGVGWVMLSVLADAGVRVGRWDRVLVLGFSGGSSLVVPSLVFGNVNPVLVVCIAVAFWSGVRGCERLAGVGWAVPAIVKVFPAAFGLYVMVRRSWRSLLVAVGTGVGVGVVSLVVFGIDLHVTYLVEAVLPRRRSAAFAGGLPPGAEYVTVRRPLSYLVPSAPELLGVLAVGVVAPLVAAVLWTIDSSTVIGALIGLHTVVVGVLVVLPSYQLYSIFVVPSLIGLVVGLSPGPGRTVFCWGAALTTLTVQLPDVLLVLDGTTWWEGLLRAIVVPVLTVGTPPLYGLLLTVGGCYLVAREPASTVNGGAD